jgi:CHAT domain-containing protein
MRDISEKDLQKLKIYSEEIMSCISLVPKFFAEEILHYGEVTTKMDVDYGVLRIRYSETDPNILQMELERGRIGDVVRPKPIIETIRVPSEAQSIIEDSIRRLLQVIARDQLAELGMAILDIGKLEDIIKKVGDLMYKWFPTRIKQQLSKMPPRSLLTLALEDKVVGLPWEIAYDGTDFLGMKFAVGRIIYSDGRLLQQRKSRPETRILLVSNPDGSLPSDVKVAMLLKEKMQKAGAIVDHFSIDAEDHFFTSKENILKALESGLYDIIHFMGHSYYNPEYPESSSFLVADGHISAVDITRALDKTIESGREPPFLFYAHSCEAGAQKSWDSKSYESQILGLSTAFLLHNVAYIGAIWAAKFKKEEIWGADKLALAFYDELLDRKQPLGLALRNAKLSLKEEGDPSCEWANFVLYGDPSLIIKI